ncbi:hypothetical protein C8Q79DRAFT_157971 [Trametes meyenii]|nr:hypothetical protein C8Q79DRAFT_157971 [Trametes meyenii]
MYNNARFALESVRTGIYGTSSWSRSHGVQCIRRACEYLSIHRNTQCTRAPNRRSEPGGSTQRHPCHNTGYETTCSEQEVPVDESRTRRISVGDVVDRANNVVWLAAPGALDGTRIIQLVQRWTKRTCPTTFHRSTTSSQSSSFSSSSFSPLSPLPSKATSRSRLEPSSVKPPWPPDSTAGWPALDDDGEHSHTPPRVGPVSRRRHIGGRQRARPEDAAPAARSRPSQRLNHPAKRATEKRGGQRRGAGLTDSDANSALVVY